MARLSAEQIYVHAVAAGFSPDEAVTMTAIALAESGGETGSLNDHNEYSVGLWQINLDAHRDKFGTWDLTDPAQNAKAAYIVSQEGEDISPWTVTHLTRDGARYRQFEAQALDAARLNSHIDVAGNFDGTQGYGHAAAAGTDALPERLADTDVLPEQPPIPPAPPGESDTSLERFLKLAVAQEGDPYDTRHSNVSMTEADPATLDCSELVEWAARRSGATIADGSWLQYFDVVDRGGEMSVEEALATPGALLFRFDPPPTRGGGRPGNKAHVAISLGDGRTIEAMSPSRGIAVNESPAASWTAAGIIPEFRGQHVDLAEVEKWRGQDANNAELLGLPMGDVAVAAQSPPLTADVVTAADSDRDGLTDRLETERGWDPHDRDSDGDGYSDLYELLEVGSDPGNADTDGDGMIDSIERLVGRNALVADSSAAPAPEVVFNTDGDVDTDGDGVPDGTERLHGFDVASIDSDDDGFTDLVELDMIADPPVHDPLLLDEPLHLDDVVADG